MALKPVLPPDGATEALSSLKNFLRQDDASPARLIPQAVGQPFLSLGLQQLAEGGKLLPTPNASAGWRFLFRQPGERGQTIAADVKKRTEGPIQMTGVWRGPQVEKLAAAIDTLKTLQEVQERDYSPRILRIPGLHIEAFWLKAEMGGADLVVPFLAPAKDIQVLRAYPAEEFFRTCRRLAIEHLEHSRPETE